MKNFMTDKSEFIELLSPNNTSRLSATRAQANRKNLFVTEKSG